MSIGYGRGYGCLTIKTKKIIKTKRKIKEIKTKITNNNKQDRQQHIQ